MKDIKSVYKCPVCEKEIEAKAGKYMRCKDCGKDMIETAKGVITK